MLGFLKKSRLDGVYRSAQRSRYLKTDNRTYDLDYTGHTGIGRQLYNGSTMNGFKDFQDQEVIREPR
jgi:hypothetical protein